MVTLTIPTKPGFTRRRWGILSNTQLFESPITKSVHTNRLTGERWLGEWVYPPMKARAIIAPWEVFLIDLDGRAGRFFATPPFRGTGRGILTGTPLVDGADQTGVNLDTDGWTPSTTNIMRKGDWFTVNGELKICKADVNSDVGGSATITFKPALRNSPANDDALTVVNPTATMMMTIDEQAWDVDQFEKFGFAFAAIEVWEAP